LTPPQNKMGRQKSKNAGSMGSEGLRYHERQALGFGTMTERLGKETVKDFHCCALSLSPAADPVVTPDGVLFDREHILRCLLHQKKEMKRLTLAWEAQSGEDLQKVSDEESVARAAAIEKFHTENQMGGGGSGGSSIAAKTLGDETSETAMDAAASVKRAQLHATHATQINAFWLPSKTPNAETRAEKPPSDTTCPVTLKKLRMKHLVDVKWTKAPAEEGNTESALDQKYMCPVTRKTFTNATQVVILTPSGDAISEEAYKMVVATTQKNDGEKQKMEYDGRKVTGVIKLQKGGSGYAGSGTQVESKAYNMLGAGSGLADSRGQKRGGASRFGLKFN
jgi:nitric oxide synthase-interacting protein